MRAGTTAGWLRLPRVVEVGPEGHAHDVRWDPVPGATSVEVTEAEAIVGPAGAWRERVETLDDLPLERQGGHVVVRFPEPVRVRALVFSGLQRARADDAVAYRDRADLEGDPDGRRRLIVAIPRGGGGSWEAPSVAVPPMSAGPVLPTLMTGAELRAGRLTLPGLRASALRLSLTTGDRPSELQPEAFSVDRVDAEVVRMPVDLSLVGPDGQAQWASPGELPPDASVTTVELASSVRRGFEAARAAGAPLRIEVRLTSAVMANARFEVGPIRGVVSRSVPDPVATVLEGDPVPVQLGPPAMVPPDEVRANVRVRYSGMRILAEASDCAPLPAAAEGVIVGVDPVALTPPPRALTGRRVARVGLVGRAIEDTELSVTLTDGAGSSTDPAGVASVPASRTLRRVWVLLDSATAPEASRFEVRANVGRFHWVVRDDRPSALVIVHDDDPGGRPIRLAGRTLVELNDEVWELPDADLTSAFSIDPTMASSELFVTVEISNLIARYLRG